MKRKSFNQCLSHLRDGALRLAAPSLYAGRKLALGAVALALLLSNAGLEGALIFDRGPSEREIHFDLPDSPLGGLLTFVQNQGDFVRQNPDGSYWLHGFASEATMHLGLPLVDEWHTPEEMIVFFVGSGRFTWFDLVTRNDETGAIQNTSERSVISADFNLTSTAAAQELLEIPKGTPFQFKARIVVRDGEDKLFNIIFEPLE